MLVRCAYYVGTVAPENRKTFDDYVLNVHLPDVASWPRLRLRLLKNNGEPYLDEVPRYYQCFELSFDSQQDMDFCMASQARSPRAGRRPRISPGSRIVHRRGPSRELQGSPISR
jgi:hypothetical protein